MKLISAAILLILSGCTNANIKEEYSDDLKLIGRNYSDCYGIPTDSSFLHLGRNFIKRVTNDSLIRGYYFADEINCDSLENSVSSNFAQKRRELDFLYHSKEGYNEYIMLDKFELQFEYELFALESDSNIDSMDGLRELYSLFLTEHNNGKLLIQIIRGNVSN